MGATRWRRIALTSLPTIILGSDITIPHTLEYLLVTKDLRVNLDPFTHIDHLIKTLLINCDEVIHQGWRHRGGGVNPHQMAMVYRAHDSWTAIRKEWGESISKPESLRTFYSLLNQQVGKLFLRFHLYIRTYVREVIESVNTPTADMIETILSSNKYHLPPKFGESLDDWAIQSLALATQGAIKVIFKERTDPGPRVLNDSILLREGLPFSIRHLTRQHNPVLGEGSFGQVVFLQIEHSSTAIAVKTFKSLHKFKWRDFVNEVMIHRALSNEPHVIQCHGAAIIMGSNINPVILMEPLIPPPHLAPTLYGQLDAIVVQIKQRMPADFAISALRYFQRQAISAVESVHAHGFLHLDIKPTNFVVGVQNKRWLLKITDFGFSQNRDTLHRNPRGYRARGTPTTMAPELCNQRPPDYPSDIFSLGATLYFTETNKYPFNRGKLGNPKWPNWTISPWIIQALDSEPSRRPTAREIHGFWATLSPPEHYPADAFERYFPSP